MKTNKQSTEQEAKRNKCLEWIKNDPKLSEEFNAMTPQEIIKQMLGTHSSNDVIATINQVIPHVRIRHQDERSERNNLRSNLFLMVYLYEAGIPENYDYDNLDQRRGYLECMRKAMAQA